MIKLDKHLKKIPSFEIVLQTNNSNSIINASSSNTSHDFNLIMDETLLVILYLFTYHFVIVALL